MFRCMFGRVGEQRFGVSLTRPEVARLRDWCNAVLAKAEPKPDPLNPAHAALAVEAARARGEP